MESLTARQFEVLTYIVNYWRDEQVSPTIRDLCRYFGFSINGVVCHLEALEKKGVIRRKPGCARGIIVLDTRLANAGDDVAV